MAPLLVRLLLLGGGAAAAAAPLPHLIVVAVDDWGWNNWQYHARNQSNANEIITPHIDALAASGVVLDRHYVHQFCSPSRSALHTGRHPIHVNVLNSALAAANTSDPVSGFAGIPRNMTALPAKLKTAGYATSQSGKWHLGLATPDHTPLGRGYDTSLTYLDGANDYWDSTTNGWCGAGLYTDLWSGDTPAYGLNNSWACSQAHQPASCKYEEDVFANFTLDAIRSHDPSVPLFMYYAPHSVHMPLEVPDAQLAKFAFIEDVSRRKYAAMVNYVDAHIGEIVAALTAKGMWNNTLLLLSADNGGPVYGPASTCVKCDGSAGANNFPLRGGKVRPFV
jgi:arylsulfatase B